MYEHIEKPKENNRRAVANAVVQKKANAKQGFMDNRLEVVAQRKRQEMVNNNRPQVSSLRLFDMMIDKHSQPSQLHSFAGKYTKGSLHPVQMHNGVLQRQEKPNVTGASKDSVKGRCE